MPELEEVKEIPKKTFMQKPNSNQEKIEREEEELKELLSEQDNVKEEGQQVEKTPKSSEEKTFKKRYGDLRSHSQKQTDELQAKVKQLETQLDASTKESIKLPKTEEEIEAWAQQYPDVAGIIETIAIRKSQEQSQGLKDRIQEIDEMQEEVERNKAEAHLMKLHPDFADIRNQDEFHEWAEEQPKWIQDVLYENDVDALAAARAIDLYKSDKGIKATKKKSNKDAAFAVSTQPARSRPQSDETVDYLRESSVQEMSSDEYEKHQDDIMEAIRTNKFIYDISGSAR